MCDGRRAVGLGDLLLLPLTAVADAVSRRRCQAWLVAKGSTGAGAVATDAGGGPSTGVAKGSGSGDGTGGGARGGAGLSIGGGGGGGGEASVGKSVEEALGVSVDESAGAAAGEVAWDAAQAAARGAAGDSVGTVVEAVGEAVEEVVCTAVGAAAGAAAGQAVGVAAGPAAAGEAVWEATQAAARGEAGQVAEEAARETAGQVVEEAAGEEVVEEAVGAEVGAAAGAAAGQAVGTVVGQAAGTAAGPAAGTTLAELGWASASFAGAAERLRADLAALRYAAEDAAAAAAVGGDADTDTAKATRAAALAALAAGSVVRLRAVSVVGGAPHGEVRADVGILRSDTDTGGASGCAVAAWLASGRTEAVPWECVEVLDLRAASTSSASTSEPGTGVGSEGGEVGDELLAPGSRELLARAERLEESARAVANALRSARNEALTVRHTARGAGHAAGAGQHGEWGRAGVPPLWLLPATAAEARAAAFEERTGPTAAATLSSVAAGARAVQAALFEAAVARVERDVVRRTLWVWAAGWAVDASGKEDEGIAADARVAEARAAAAEAAARAGVGPANAAEARAARTRVATPPPPPPPPYTAPPRASLPFKEAALELAGAKGGAAVDMRRVFALAGRVVALWIRDDDTTAGRDAEGPGRDAALAAIAAVHARIAAASSVLRHHFPSDTLKSPQVKALRVAAVPLPPLPGITATKHQHHHMKPSRVLTRSAEFHRGPTPIPPGSESGGTGTGTAKLHKDKDKGSRSRTSKGETGDSYVAQGLKETRKQKFVRRRDSGDGMGNGGGIGNGNGTAVSEKAAAAAAAAAALKSEQTVHCELLSQGGGAGGDGAPASTSLGDGKADVKKVTDGWGDGKVVTNGRANGVEDSAEVTNGWVGGTAGGAVVVTGGRGGGGQRQVTYTVRVHSSSFRGTQVFLQLIGDKGTVPWTRVTVGRCRLTQPDPRLTPG